MRSRLGTCGNYLALVLLTACSGTRSAAPPPEVIPPGVPAPDPLTSPFFPDNYKAALLVDYAALRECGLLAYFERMPMFESWLTANARQFGCELDDLDRVHTAVVFEQWGPGSDKVHWRLISVAETAAVRPQQPDPGWVATEIRGHQGFRAPTANQQDLTFWPKPGLAVNGYSKLLEALCKGDMPAGGPHPDVRALLAGDRVLFQYAFGRFGKKIWALCATIGFPFPFDDNDPVDFVRLRLSLGADGGLLVSLLFQYGAGTSGLRATEEWVRTGLLELAAKPAMATVRPLLGAVEIKAAGRDLTMTLPLGPPRQAVQKIERVLLSVMSNR